MADLPARLVVLYARLEATGADRLRFEPERTRLVLPGGHYGRVFDAPRAAVLLERADLAKWELDYTTDVNHPPGGLAKHVSDSLKQKVREGLLSTSEFGPEQVLTGYIVADTGIPLRSLQDVKLEVFATRVRDDRHVRVTYHFAAKEMLQR